MRRVIVSAVLSLAVGLAGAAPGLGAPVYGQAPPPAPPPRVIHGKPGAAGVGDPYYPLYGNGGYDVRHYAIDTTYRTDTGALAGAARISAQSTQALSRFNLDFVLHVDSVQVDGRPARFSTAHSRELVITPAAAIASHQPFTVVVRYHGVPGKTRVNGKSPWLSSRTEALAMGEPEIAAWWFPSNDHPRDKATYDITVHVPKHQQAISNGILVSRKTDGVSTAWHWRMSTPMASYLALLAVGQYDIHTGTAHGRPYVNAVSRAIPAASRARQLHLLDRTPEVVQWLSTQFGPYPFEATGAVSSPLANPVGSMESQSRPAYLDQTPWWTTEDEAIGLIVHENAHQWVGDLVSVDRWRDTWLNEGFATWTSYRWDEAHGGPSAQAELLQQWEWDYSDWTVDLDNPGAANPTNRELYGRGWMTVQALRHRIGEKAFRTLLRRWVAAHRNGNARVVQFEVMAAQVSGKDLRGFFNAWLRADRRPARTVANGLR